MKKKVLLVLIVVLILVVIGFVYYNSEKKEGGFEINTAVLKFAIKQGESLTSSIKITNLKEKSEFKVEGLGLENLISFDKNNFVLDKNEEKEIKIGVNKDLSYSPGVYVGSLIVTRNEKKEIPLIVEIRSKEVLFATNLDIAPEYKEIGKGERFSAGIKIFNLNDTRTHELEIIYLVKGLNGEGVVSEAERVTAGTETALTKTIVIPDDIKQGGYVFSVSLELGDSFSTSSYLFSVKQKGRIANLNFDLITLIFSLMVVVFLAGIIFIIFRMFQERDKFFLALKKQHDKELKEVLERIEQQKKKYVSRAKGRKKKIIEIQLKEAEKRTIEKLKKKYEKQKQELARLKRHKRENLMQKKLDEWKKQGFNISEFLGEVKKLPKSKMIEKWKKQGYDTSILKQ